MRKLFFAGSTIILGLFSLAHIAFAEEIKQFDVQATLSADRSLLMTETIVYDFGNVNRHGIFRMIPEAYERNGNNYNLHLQFVKATMDGFSIPSQTISQGKSREIKLGDPEILINGVHTYVIQYRTDHAINTFPDHDELYWNVTGDEWQMPIDQTSFTLEAPGTIDRAVCFTGLSESRASDCDLTKTDKQLLVKNRTVFLPGEQLTIVASFPKGVIQPLTTKQAVSSFLRDNTGALLPLLVLVLMFIIWFTHGREPRGRGTILAQYEAPQGFTPGMMASVIHQRFSSPAMAGTMLDMARRGFLKIKWRSDDPKKIILLKGNEPDITAHKFETILWKGLFSLHTEIDTGAIPSSFALALAQAKTTIFSELMEHEVFKARPATIRGLWMGGGALLGFFGLFQLTGAISVACVLSGLIIVCFGWFMPRMTKKGAIVKEEILGFKTFLSVTETERLKFTDAPKLQPSQFAEFLPAAVALGVEEQWAKQFTGMTIEQPSYITGNGVFNALVFSHAFHMAGTSLANVHAQTAGRGGSGFSGGFSGGGFGGGGGGSW